MSIVNLSLTKNGSGLPFGSDAEGPIVDTSTAGIDTRGSLALTGSYQQITGPASAAHVILTVLTWPATNNVTIAGGSGDTGINMGNTWNWLKLPILGGTGTLYLKAASGTNAPTVYYEFV